MHSGGDAAEPGWRQGLRSKPLISEDSSALSGVGLSHWKVRPERGKFQRSLFPKVPWMLIPKCSQKCLPGPASFPRHIPQPPGKAGPHLGGGHWYLIGGTVINPVPKVMVRRLWTCHLFKPCSSAEHGRKHSFRASCPGLWWVEPGEVVRRAQEQGSHRLPELHGRQDPGYLCNELIAPTEWVK